MRLSQMLRDKNVIGRWNKEVDEKIDIIVIIINGYSQPLFGTKPYLFVFPTSPIFLNNIS